MENSSIDEIGNEGRVFYVFNVTIVIFLQFCDYYLYFLSNQRPVAEKKMDRRSSETPQSTYSGSSKTESSRSDQTVKPEPEDRDFTKDNGKLLQNRISLGLNILIFQHFLDSFAVDRTFLQHLSLYDF